jgi:hypothetical protein
MNYTKHLLILSLLGSLGSLTSAQSKDDGKAAFDRLLAAHDSEIMDVVKNNNLVCFADKNPEWVASDRFLVVLATEPEESSWINAEGSGSDKTIYGSESAFAKQYGYEAVFVWEHEDNELWVSSGLVSEWHGYGHYTLQGGKRRWVPDPNVGSPVLASSQKDDKGNVVESIALDSNSLSATKKYDNKNKGATDWTLSVRLSTGRYRETWDATATAPLESLGRCYRAKTLSTATAAGSSKAKTKP